MEWLVFVARLVVGAVFLMSSLTKLAGPREFVSNVQSYRVLPRPMATAYALTLPYLELGAAILLFLGIYAVWASLGVALMLLSFMVSVGMVMHRGQHLACSCFGLLYRERVGWTTQFRDGLMLLMALAVLIADDGSLALTNLLAHVSRPGFAAALAGSIVLFVVSLGAVAVSFGLDRARKRSAAQWQEAMTSIPDQGVRSHPHTL